MAEAAPGSVVSSARVHTFVVGASAGGIEALRQLVPALPADFPAVVLIVLHLAPSGTSVLPQILQRAGELPACHAEDGGPLHGGCIYVAPPDRHLLIADGLMRLDAGPRVNGHRPAVDVLFESAARAYGPETAGVVLSGVLDDGTAGLMAIKRAGGMTFAQDPDEALYDMMPRNAIELVHPDRVASARDLGLLLTSLAKAPDGPPPRPTPAVDPTETALIAVDRGATDRPQPGHPSGLTCPECNGALWESEEGDILRFRCRIGHEYGSESFTAHQADRLEAALWTALRAMEERADLHRRIAARQRRRGNTRTAQRFALRAEDSVEQAMIVRGLLDEVRSNVGEASGAA